MERSAASAYVKTTLRCMTWKFISCIKRIHLAAQDSGANSFDQVLRLNRALQGVAAGGILGLVIVVISDLFSMRRSVEVKISFALRCTDKLTGEPC